MYVIVILISSCFLCILEEEAVTFLQKMAKQLKLPHRIYRVCLPSFLANVNVSSRSLYAIARPSVCLLSSVTLVRPTQAVQVFGNISTAFGTLAIR